MLCLYLVFREKIMMLAGCGARELTFLRIDCYAGCCFDFAGFLAKLPEIESLKSPLLLYEF